MEYLSHRGYDPAFGARPVKRVVQRELESELARARPRPPMPRLVECCAREVHRIQVAKHPCLKLTQQACSIMMSNISFVDPSTDPSGRHRTSNCFNAPSAAVVCRLLHRTHLDTFGLAASRRACCVETSARATPSSCPPRAAWTATACAWRCLQTTFGPRMPDRAVSAVRPVLCLQSSRCAQAVWQAVTCHVQSTKPTTWRPHANTGLREAHTANKVSWATHM